MTSHKDLAAFAAHMREHEFDYLKTTPPERTVYDLTDAEARALGENGPDRWWVIIERSEYDPPYAALPDLAFGPYPSEEAVTLALDSALIDGECTDTKRPYNIDECAWSDTRKEDAEVILVDLTDPNHTGIYPKETP